MGYKGFQIETKGDKSRIFLAALGYILTVPTHILQEIHVQPSQSLELKDDTFVSINGELGIIIYYADYENPIAYIPDFDEKIAIDGYQILEEV